MRVLTYILVFSICSLSIAQAECTYSVITQQISQNGFLSESDRPRLTQECEDFERFKKKVMTDPTDAYILSSGCFTCIEREDYIYIYNYILERGGEYYLNDIRKFNKACIAVKKQALAKIVNEKPGDPVVQIRYPSRWEPGILNTMWVHKKYLIPYAGLMENKLK